MRLRIKLSQKGWIYPLVITVAGFCYYISFYNYGINLGDEGYIVYGSARVLRGQLPVSDFMSYPPGSYFLLAIFFKLFGESLLVSRFMEMTFLVIDGILTFYIGKRLMPERWALVPSFILIAFPGFWHKVFLTFSLLLPLVMLLRFLERRTMVRILGVGWAVGMALVFRIEAALFSSITILAVLFCYHIWKDGVFLINREALSGFLKELTLCGLAALSILTPVLIYYHYQSDLGRFFHSLREGYGSSNIAWTGDFFEKPSLLRIITKFRIGKNLFFFLTAVLYLYFSGKAVVHFFIEKRKDFPLFIPILFLGVLCLIYPYIAFSNAHLLQVAAMSYVLFSLLIYSIWQRKGLKSRTCSIFLILLLCLYLFDNFKWRSHFASGSISRLYRMRVEGARLISSHKANIYVENKNFDATDGLIRFFEGKNGYLLPLTFESMVNFLTGLENPTRHTILTPPLLQSVAQQREVIGDIERYKIKYLLIMKPIWEGRESLGFRVYAPLIYEFVSEHYQLEKEVGYFLIFSRQSFQNGMIQGGAER